VWVTFSANAFAAVVAGSRATLCVNFGAAVLCLILLGGDECD
jgi:hypothetical protein